MADLAGQAGRCGASPGNPFTSKPCGQRNHQGTAMRAWTPVKIIDEKHPAFGTAGVVKSDGLRDQEVTNKRGEVTGTRRVADVQLDVTGAVETLGEEQLQVLG